MTTQRQLLRRMFDAAVAAAHPAHMLAPHLPPAPEGRLMVLAAGKAAAAMAAAAERHYLDDTGLAPERLVGLAVTRHGHGHPTRRVRVVEAGHPTPDAAGLAATEAVLALAAEATADDLVLVLLSGGGSANWVAPAPGLDIAAKQAVTRALLRSGAGIGEINVVRKHLSRIKGGRLARLARPARLVTLAISDVPRDDPATIASGPTVPDPSTLADARAIVERYGIERLDPVWRALGDAANETLKPGDPAFAATPFTIVATPRAALDAAAAIAREAGYEVLDLGADLEGEARDVAREHAERALAARAQGRRLAILSGGELTVTMRGKGRGGPNQEYALSLAIALRSAAGIHALAADTDGADGGGGAAHDPAGAFVGPDTLARGPDPDVFLADNDSTSFFEATGDLLITGPTLTNVNDLRVVLIDPSGPGR